jgi:hypothetical protein
MNDEKQDDGIQHPGIDQETGDDEMQAAGATQDKDAQRRGGEHSHGGSQSASSADESAGNRSAGSNQPRGAAVDKDAQRKGGKHSHGGR